MITVLVLPVLHTDDIADTKSFGCFCVVKEVPVVLGIDLA